MIQLSIFFLLLKFKFIICDLTSDQIATVDLPPKGFGKFFTKLRYLEQCSDSGVTIDPVNAHKFKLSISKINEIDEGLNGYFVVNDYYRMTKGKLTPFISRKGAMVPTLNQTTTTPCKHPILSFPLKLFLSLDDKCGIKKGNYTVDNLNMNKYAHMVAGDNFIYVRAHVTVEYFSDVGRTFCLIVVLDLKPIPKIPKKKKPKVP